MKKTALILATLILSPVIAGAEEGHQHSHSKTHGDVNIPATLGELWTGLQAEHSKLIAALEKKDAPGALKITETLMAYTEALPGKVEGLDDAKMQRITGQTKNLTMVYDSILHSAEDAAFDKSLKDATKATAVLKLLEAQLPLKK